MFMKQPASSSADWQVRWDGLNHVETTVVFQRPFAKKIMPSSWPIWHLRTWKLDLRNCFQSFTSGPVHCPLEEIIQ